jgi:hypothetical protein
MPCQLGPAASPHWPGAARFVTYTLRAQKISSRRCRGHHGGAAQQIKRTRPARFNPRVVGKGACRDDKPHTPSLTGDGAP